VPSVSPIVRRCSICSAGASTEARPPDAVSRNASRREQRLEGQERAAGILRRQGVEDRGAQFERRAAEELPDRLGVELADPGGERLVEQGERVACGSRAAARDEHERLVVGLDAFEREDRGEVTAQLLGGEQRELEVLGPRPDGRQHLLRVGRRQHEDHVLRRFLEGLQQSVRGPGGELVHLVDDVDLAAAAGAPVSDPVDQLPDLVDPVVGRGVDLDHVERGAVGDREARLALPVGLAVGARTAAVERLGQDAGGARLAGAARPGEEVGVAHSVVPDRVAERDRDVGLADEIAERLGPVLAVQRLVSHDPTTLPAASRNRSGAASPGAGLRLARRTGPGDPTAHRRAR
jgi:hypothetical protein